MSWFPSPEEKAKKEILSELPSKIIKKIADANNIDYDDAEEATEEIVENMSLKEIQNYAKGLQMQAGRGVQKVSERNIKKTLENWSVGRYKTEKGYETELTNLLYKKFDRKNVKFQSGENNVDIEVSNGKKRYPIELKYNFDMGDRDRVVGQLDRYWREYRNKTFLVICGIKEHDNGWTEFERYVKPKFKHKMHLIVKSKAEIKA
ncbi:MAG: hypothetical protein M1286_03190 [Candidatus Marsarchaeota archaeon]|nr:hypothetical protein [Candidatus Marsarchaeota archaeon]